MPKPKTELMDLSKICSATHAKGAILEIETEIKFHRDEIFKIWETKVKELSDEIGGHFWCIDEYKKVIENIKTEFQI